MKEAVLLVPLAGVVLAMVWGTLAYGEGELSAYGRVWIVDQCECQREKLILRELGFGKAQSVPSEVGMR